MNFDENPNTEPTGLFAQLRAAVVARLAAAEGFSGPNPVPVLDAGRRNILKALQETLLKRTEGLCLSVSVPRIDPGEDSPQAIRATISVMIYERPLINWSEKGRQLALEDAGEIVLQTLGFDENLAPGWSPSAVWDRFQLAGMRIVFSNNDQAVMEVTFTTGTSVRATPIES